MDGLGPLQQESQFHLAGRLREAVRQGGLPFPDEAEVEAGGRRAAQEAACPQEEGKARGHPGVPPPPEPAQGAGKGGVHLLPVQVGPEVLRQGGRGAVPEPGVGLETLDEDVLQIPVHLAVRGQLDGALAPGLASRRGQGAARRAAVQEVVEGPAQAIHVCGRTDQGPVAPELLGGHVGRRADDPVAGGEGRLVQGHGQAEVADVGHPLAVLPPFQKDVGGLEVAVDELEAVGRVDALGHLGHEGHRLVGGEVGARLVQVEPPHQLHGDHHGAVRHFHVVDPADVGVGHPGVHLGLVHEADHRRGVHVPQDLEGHHAAEHHVPALQHFAHAPLAQEGAEDVASHARALGVQPRGLELQGVVGHGHDDEGIMNPVCCERDSVQII